MTIAIGRNAGLPPNITFLRIPIYFAWYHDAPWHQASTSIYFPRWWFTIGWRCFAIHWWTPAVRTRWFTIEGRLLHFWFPKPSFLSEGRWPCTLRTEASISSRFDD